MAAFPVSENMQCAGGIGPFMPSVRRAYWIAPAQPFRHFLDIDSALSRLCNTEQVVPAYPLLQDATHG